CLDWKKFKWKSFVIGGVDDGETPEEAVRREVIEETGYSDIKSIKPIAFETHAEFYAKHKEINRYGKYKAFLVELASDKHEKPSDEHTKNHEGIWVEKNKVSGFINLENNRLVWNDYIKGGAAYTENGKLINSSEFDGINNREAIDKITLHLKKQKIGKKVINFKLRDWGISRQRYWGTPIPIIHCEKCGAVPVSEKDLPIALPKDVEFGEGNPLETNEKWTKTKCPKCGGSGKRETDTMDTFVNSSWYFLRYADPNNDKEIFDKKKAKYWCPIDQYVGGAEHACMHLIYSRFYTKFLADLGLINFREPAKKLFHQGMLQGEGGVKMSKSKGNVVLPEVVSEKYGIDTSRLFLLSLAAPDKPRDWSEKGIQGSLRIIQKIFDYFQDTKFGKDNEKTLSKLNKTIKEVTLDIEDFAYNLAVIKIRQLFEYIEGETISKDTAEKFLKILSPFCPHIAEELWEKIGNKPFISNAKWPKANEKLIDEKLEKIEGVLDTLRGDILKIKELAKLDSVSKVKIFVAPAWKWDALAIVKKACDGKPDFGAAMKALMSKDEMKKQGKAVQPFLKAVMSRFGELSDLEKFDEVKAIEEVKVALEKEFGSIEIIKAENSKEAKANNAFPGKPALLVE
ncbi:MAG: class I tRNA ligase family protein, partial [Candidatus Diapherotrites archaeon]|nr:class I tRNA ligase family protein [Candidatus Diapherotrites archaeon]